MGNRDAVQSTVIIKQYILIGTFDPISSVAVAVSVDHMPGCIASVHLSLEGLMLRLGHAHPHTSTFYFLPLPCILFFCSLITHIHRGHVHRTFHSLSSQTTPEPPTHHSDPRANSCDIFLFNVHSHRKASPSILSKFTPPLTRI